ncbi:hypothetical protein M406DRAFT_333095 [Cryphonectria parasitica EP155]|uniref:Uncharacterized protein n=1 Tax=Cryphonectria parasitica (strain ATCC 38755 / EP155) TaxID=660469 RepID=A0A9P5CMB7_CRYP1|nr:uncharacterized protein M406DRAFT_333095 [Cryphonectria parasitica EP155]KAF3762725.1 hypothetical protein M406DRAFT_333095 [Cryphonectria parasitica EP155]
MPLKSPRRSRDLEKAVQSVRFVDEPRSSTDSEIAARPRLVQPRRSWRSRIISPEVIPWVLTCVFATTTILLLLQRPESRRFGSYEMRFRTDLKSLEAVPLEVKRFYGSPNFDENGTMHTPDVDKHAHWPENKLFVGEPSHEIDDNWLDLIGDRYFSISEEEAIEAWGERRHEYVDEDHGGYTAGLDVFHTLHCLNQIRMALSPDHYNHHGMPVETSAAHTAHCLDAIRQHVQCYGSTTLIPTKWRDGAQRQYIDSNQEHVCRDFSYLRKFVKRRNLGGDLYVSRDKSLRHSEEDKEEEVVVVVGVEEVADGVEVAE